MAKVNSNDKLKKKVIIFKIKDKYNVPYTKINLNFNSLKDKEFKEYWKKIKIKFPKLVLHPLFTAISPKAINELVDKAIKLTPSYKPTNFLNFFYATIDINDYGNHLSLIITDLANSELFESIQVKEEITVPSQVFPENEEKYRNGEQGYLNPANLNPTGIDANAAWNERDIVQNYIGDGTGINFIDIEFGWHFNHEDLTLPDTTTLNMVNRSDQEHGTSVLGIVAAKNNTTGCIGIAPNCVVSTIGIPYNPALGDDIHNAIAFALNSFRSGIIHEGDVILLEVENGGMPLETMLGIPELITLMTALKLIIIEPAGNGGFDLDSTPSLNSVNPATFIETGAIVIGGASKIGLTRNDGASCFGNRVNCFAWFDGVTAASGPAIDDYTNNFNGTSAAGAIIAGTAVVIQSISYFKFGRKLIPEQMRALLSNPALGTPSNNPASDKIGCMPDLNKIINRLNNPEKDIYIRDNIYDIGDRHNGLICISPDIITCNSQILPISDAVALYGNNSGTENSYFLGDSYIINNQDNYIYVRVKNKSHTDDAKDVEIKMYYSEVATLITPDRWNYIGSRIIDVVPAGNILTVTENPITWHRTDVPAAGHYCYICIISNTDDPAPLADQIDLASDIDNFYNLIRNNNNITWKNFNVVDVSPSFTGLLALPFLLVGDKHEKKKFDLYFTAVLPEDAIIQFEFPVSIRELFKDKGFEITPKSKDTAYIEWKKYKLLEINDLMFPQGLASECKIKIRFKTGTNYLNDYQISVTQVYNNNIIGKITWQIKPKL